MHEGIKDFKCELCPYATATRKELRNHITVVHEKRKDYNCDTCGKLFGNSGYLSTHIKTVHGNTRDYKCKYCPRDFKTLSSKKEHEQVCPNNKQKVYHICKTCGKTFMQTRTLATHNREVHEGRRNHKCESCGKAFSNSGRRKRHIHTVHKGLKPHQWTHIKRCHPNECKSLEEKK